MTPRLFKYIYINSSYFYLYSMFIVMWTHTNYTIIILYLESIDHERNEIFVQNFRKVKTTECIIYIVAFSNRMYF